MDQVAERAGFKYHNTYTFLPELPEYPRKSWDEYLAWAVSTYDIVAERFMLTAQRQVGGSVRGRALRGCPTVWLVVAASRAPRTRRSHCLAMADQTKCTVKGMGVSFVKGWYDASLVLVVAGTAAASLCR